MKKRRKKRRARKHKAYQEIEKLYSYCPRCSTLTEECHALEHRGITRCMECGGGVADDKKRVCVNCCDLPFRKLREEGLGEPIHYESEIQGD